LKRLVEEDLSPEACAYWLAELVRATPRLPPTPFQQRRILADLGRPTVSTRLWIGRAGALAVTLGATAAAAASAAQHRWPWERARAPVATLAAAAPPLPHAAPSPAVAAPSSLDTGSLSVPPSTADRGTERPVLHPPRHLESRAIGKNGEEPTLVLEAIRALRNRGDGVRAGMLLTEYLKGHPQGVLVEDATALSVEAAVARHDERAAGEIARRYLSQFPSGRYRRFALRALESSEP
jgi:hypothetical protein